MQERRLINRDTGKFTHLTWLLVLNVAITLFATVSVIWMLVLYHEQLRLTYTEVETSTVANGNYIEAVYAGSEFIVELTILGQTELQHDLGCVSNKAYVKPNNSGVQIMLSELALSNRQSWSDFEMVVMCDGIKFYIESLYNTLAPP